MESANAKVVLVTDQHPLSGIGVYVTRLRDLLSDRFPEIEVRNLHYFRYPPSTVHQPVAGQRYARSRLGGLRALRWNERALERELRGNHDLVHLCGASYDLAARFDPSIATVHDFGLQTFGSLRNTEGRMILVEGYAMVEWLRMPRFLRQCRGIISVSDYTRARLRHWAGLESTVIPHWIDSERFRVRPMAESRERLGLPLDRRIVLSVTSGRAYKNPVMLRRVIESLPPEYLLVKVGYHLNGLRDRVLNLGTVNEERYPHYFNAADTYLHLSLREGFGIPLIEAMSSGTPVVALANPPAPDIVGSAARLLPAGTGAAAIANAVRSIVESRDLAAQLRVSGLARIRAFDPSVPRALYTEAYLGAMRA
jgi:glycosyltransferase involved in cell wall biosynthesis